MTRSITSREIEELKKRLARASEFRFEEADLVISMRLNNRDEGSAIRWVIHRVGKPNLLCNTHGLWETQTRKAYRSDSFVGRTRMTLDEAFELVTSFLPA